MSDPHWTPLLPEFLNANSNQLCINFTQFKDYDGAHDDDDHDDEDVHDATANGRHGPAIGARYDMVMMTFVLNVYIVGILCFFGFIGNCASVVVLRRDKETSSDKNTTTTTNWLLQTLAAVDIFFLISCLLIYSVKTIHNQWPLIVVTGGYAFIDPYLPGVASIGHMLTIYTVLLVTVDRFIAVCRPLSSRHLRSIRRARLTFAGIVVLSIAYSLPVFLEQQSVVVTTTDACTNERGRHLQTVKTRMRQSALYFIIYKTICHVIFRSFGPLIAIIVLNGRLISALRRLNRRHILRKPVDRDNLTMMIVAVVSIFIVCQLPDVALRVILSAEHLIPSSAVPSSAASESSGHLQEQSFLLLSYIKVLSHVLLTLNSSVNFLVYCLIGRKFRRIFLELFLCRRRRRRTSFPLQPTTVMSEFPAVSSAASALASIRHKSSLVNVVASRNRPEVTEL